MDDLSTVYCPTYPKSSWIWLGVPAEKINDVVRLSQKACAQEIVDIVLENGPAYKILIPETGFETDSLWDATFIHRKILRPVKSSESSNVSELVREYMLRGLRQYEGPPLVASVVRDLIIAHRQKAQLLLPHDQFSSAVHQLGHMIQLTSKYDQDLCSRLKYLRSFLGAYRWHDDVSSFKIRRAANLDNLVDLMKEFELMEASKAREALIAVFASDNV